MVNGISMVMACSEAQALEIIDDLYSDETVFSVLKKHSVDSKSFYKLIASVPLITEAYTRAHSIRADIFAEEVIEVSRSDEDTNKVRNQMNALIWATSKMKPDKYGDRIDLNITNTVNIRDALDSAIARTRQVIELTSTHQIESTGSKPVETNEGDILTLDELLE